MADITITLPGKDEIADSEDKLVRTVIRAHDDLMDAVLKGKNTTHRNAQVVEGKSMYHFNAALMATVAESCFCAVETYKPSRGSAIGPLGKKGGHRLIGKRLNTTVAATLYEYVLTNINKWTVAEVGSSHMLLSSTGVAASTVIAERIGGKLKRRHDTTVKPADAAGVAAAEAEANRKYGNDHPVKPAATEPATVETKTAPPQPEPPKARGSKSANPVIDQMAAQKATNAKAVAAAKVGPTKPNGAAEPGLKSAPAAGSHATAAGRSRRRAAKPVEIPDRDYSGMNGPQLLDGYNELVEVAGRLGLTDCRPIKKFSDNASALKRCNELAARLKNLPKPGEVVEHHIRGKVTVRRIEGGHAIVELADGAELQVTLSGIEKAGRVAA